MTSDLTGVLPAQPAGMPFLQPMSMLRRRARPVLLALALALVTVLLITTLWPPTYLSTGTILIEQQEVPTDLVRSTISSYADQRIQVISQRVMTTANLLQIIQKYDLYPAERRKKGRESIIQMMREDIQFRAISADVIDPRQGRPVQATIAFSLGYQSRSPDLAARVANELSSLYLQENLSTRRQLAEEATSFLGEEADKLSDQINELEARLASFKELNLRNLPEVALVNMQLVNRGDEERRDIDAQVQVIDQQLVYLNAQLAQMNPSSQIFTSTGERVMSAGDRLKVLRSDYERSAALYNPEHPDVVRLKRLVDGLERSAATQTDANDRARELQSAQSELGQARQRYSADHPDVLRLERLVANLQAAGTVEPDQPEVTSQDADSPAYIQLRTQREALATQRKSLLDKRGALATRMRELETRLEASPGVEREYAGMRRDLENTQMKYREVRQKQMEAQLAQSLEVERKGERFSLIEPPLVPEEPTSPNRQVISVLGVIVALALSAGIAVAMEFMDGSIRGAAHLGMLVTAPPLAVIPRFTRAMPADRRLRLRLVFAAGCMALVALVLAMVHIFYRPLDVLWAILLRKLGG